MQIENEKKILEELPKEFKERNTRFNNGGSFLEKPKAVDICSLHTKEHWLEGEYVDNKDGTVSCTHCGWGCQLAGYYKVLFGKVIDLRALNKS